MIQLKYSKSSVEPVSMEVLDPVNDNYITSSGVPKEWSLGASV